VVTVEVVGAVDVVVFSAQVVGGVVDWGVVSVVSAGVVVEVVCSLILVVAASVVTGTGQVVDAQIQSNQSPLLNFEYTRTLVPFDK
jgi:hypothetical protein